VRTAGKIAEPAAVPPVAAMAAMAPGSVLRSRVDRGIVSQGLMTELDVAREDMGPVFGLPKSESLEIIDYFRE
jgi:hypothetical protein